MTLCLEWLSRVTHCTQLTLGTPSERDIYMGQSTSAFLSDGKPEANI
ncbi:MAG TPA: hypothetical protein VMA13_10675 [Candidatus Saccharimonadales bacterium]|nr:hypothetical protein [Candidatus Saccharimonadales bacterium]